MARTLLVVCVLAHSLLSHAQQASIKKVELAGEKIVVHYDLDDSNPAHEYRIQLYSSQSNFATAHTKVAGDVGNEIKPGIDKKITWNVREELGPYKGRLALEVRGSMFLPVARINSIVSGTSFKRGKTHLVNWRPGNPNPVNIELLKEGKPVATELNQSNNGVYSLALPSNLKPGTDYTLRITDTRNHEDFVVSQPFAVKRRVPLGLKVLPILAIGGAVMLLGGTDPQPPSSGIPDPPLPE